MARTLIIEVKSHSNELVSFIDSFYMELTEVANFPAAKAWELVGRSIGAFFESMRTIRARTSRIQDVNTMEGKVLLLWTVLQVHRITNQFISLNFQGHPAVVKEMSLFMLTQQVDPTELSALKDKVTKLDSSLTKSAGDISKLESGQATLKHSVDNVSNAVNHVKAKVK